MAVTIAYITSSLVTGVSGLKSFSSIHFSGKKYSDTLA